MTIVIRQAEARDASAIGTLAAEFQTHLRARGDAADFDWGAEKYLRDGFGDDPAFEGIVAEVGGEVVAFALYDMGYDTDRGERYVYMIDLFVSQPFRQRGLGARLMRHLADIGRARGADLIAWSVLRRDADAASFYESVGGRYEDEQRIMWRSIGATA